MIEKMPIVIPSKERKVRNRFAARAAQAKITLSFMMAKNKCILFAQKYMK
jgi:hypothetical protein